MSSIVINDLNPNDSYLAELSEEEFLSIIGGKDRKPWYERWWGKALIAVATGIAIGVGVDALTD